MKTYKITITFPVKRAMGNFHTDFFLILAESATDACDQAAHRIENGVSIEVEGGGAVAFGKNWLSLEATEYVKDSEKGEGV